MYFLKQAYAVFVDMTVRIHFAPTASMDSVEKKLIGVNILHKIPAWLENVTVDICCTKIVQHSIHTVTIIGLVIYWHGFTPNHTTFDGELQQPV